MSKLNCIHLLFKRLLPREKMIRGETKQAIVDNEWHILRDISFCTCVSLFVLCPLKRLSHEIEFKYFDKMENLYWFWNF